MFDSGDQFGTSSPTRTLKKMTVSDGIPDTTKVSLTFVPGQRGVGSPTA